MIVTCPACATRYIVDDAALSGSGRDVRCADCGHVWRYSVEGAAIHQAIAEITAAVDTGGAGGQSPPAAAAATSSPPDVGPVATTAERLRSEPRLDTPPRSPSPGTQSPILGPAGEPAANRAQPGAPPIELPAAALRRRARVRGLLLTILLIGLVVIAILARDSIIRAWPRAGQVFAVIGLREPPGQGLEVTVTPTRTADALVINGSIVNAADADRRVPRLRVTLQDASKNDIDFKVIDPPVETLAPGATARFSIAFERATIAAGEVAVTFVPR